MVRGVEQHGTRRPRKAVLALILALVMLCPGLAIADQQKEELRRQLDLLQKQMEQVRRQLDEMSARDKEKTERVEELESRMDSSELHTATDKISFGVELRTRAESIHYSDLRQAPNSMLNAFFTPVSAGGFNGATLQQIQQAMANMVSAGTVPPVDKYDADNDIAYTNRLRLEMKAKVNPKLSFSGRLAAYKVYGDSTGVKVNHGSLGDVTFDGNTSSLPHGDTIHLERAYFNYKGEMGQVPVNFSIGRRPSTDGPPLEYHNYSLEGGSPLASIINWQFDGASLTFGLEDMTGIPGASFKLCYGVGFDGQWGNSYSLSNTQSTVDDVHMFGFIASLYDDDQTSAVLSYAHAWDITDGFTGLTVMPYYVYKQDSDGDGVQEYYFEMNNAGFVSRVEPYTNIGDWDAASLLIRTNLEEKLADIDLFLAASWSHTDPSRVSRNPFYEMMGQGLLSSNGELKDRDGYSIYAGVVFPMPLDGRFGLEYNWGSQYWFNFTGAEDSLVASKLAARGQVYEAYYHQPIFGQKFFLTLGGQYYDYDYTGSGNPLGEPVKISQVNSLDALNAVVDKVWLAYLSATLRF